MDAGQFGLILGIGAALLVGIAAVGLVLAFLRGKLRPLPAKAQEATLEEAPAQPVDDEVLAARRTAYRLGLYVLIGLAVLTALEFLIATALEGSVVFLFIIALAKAGAILQYYMHVNRMWGEEEAHR